MRPKRSGPGLDRRHPRFRGGGGERVQPAGFDEADLVLDPSPLIRVESAGAVFHEDGQILANLSAGCFISN